MTTVHFEKKLPKGVHDLFTFGAGFDLFNITIDTGKELELDEEFHLLPQNELLTWEIVRYTKERVGKYVTRKDNTLVLQNAFSSMTTTKWQSSPWGRPIATGDQKLAIRLHLPREYVVKVTVNNPFFGRD